MNEEICQQIEVENGLFKLLMEGLPNILAWEVKGDDFSRKLSTLRFIAQSFQRHLERLLSLKEQDGYMEGVEEGAPQLGRNVDALRAEHEEFRAAVRQILHGLEHVLPTDHFTFASLCDQFSDLLHKLEDHHKREVDVVQEAFDRDGGGEG